MDENLISIIVPTYNGESCVERTIQSILNQTYQNIEVIVVNDGSTDNTASVLERIAENEKRVRVISKENEGVTKARLTGVRSANGYWIGFVDSDDTVDENMYKTLLDNAKKYNADISHCGYQMIFPTRTDLYYGTEKIIEQSTFDGVKDLIEANFVEPGLCIKLFKKDLFDEVLDKMDCSIKIWEDLLMNFYLFSKSKKSVFYDKCLYNYIIRKNSASTSEVNLTKLSHPIKVLNTIKSQITNDVILDSLDRRLVGRYLQVLKISSKNHNEEIKTFIKQSRVELKQVLSNIDKRKLPRKLKLQCFLAINFPFAFKVLQSIYGLVSGSKNKYKI